MMMGIKELSANHARILLSYAILVLFLFFQGGLASTVEYKVFCTPKEMTVTVFLPDIKAQVYIDKLKGYPDCKPVINGTRATFHLSLEDIFTCGTTRILDLKGRKLFYNRIVVEMSKTIKDKIRAKCETHGRNLLPFNSRKRRDVLPPGFEEPDHINITETVIGNGVVPDLNVGVRQNGQYIDTQMNVQPGTPLEMEVYLDNNSSETYGLLVTSMNVTDKTPGLREIIIFKGCSIDPYLFSNFELRNDNSVSAKFRAFKFPESSYVMFIGSVSICIGPCQGIPCSNGQLGYGRRKRDLGMNKEMDLSMTKELDRDPNQIFEITMTTILKVNENENEFIKKDSLGGTADVSNTQVIVANDNTVEVVDDNLALPYDSENSSHSAMTSVLLTAFLVLIQVFYTHL